jgi:hypothetical protein
MTENVHSDLDAVAVQAPSVPLDWPAVRAEARRRSRRRRILTAIPVVVLVVAAPVAWSAATGGGDRLVQQAGPAPTQRGDGSELAARLCADAAQFYKGDVVAAYSTTVQAIRDYMTDPPPGGRQPGLPYPTGWAEKAPDDPAAACYVDASFEAPAVPGAVNPERALIMSTESAELLMAIAGTKEALPPTPLPEPSNTQSSAAANGATRYTITYDSETTYNRHVEAVSTCLDLPGMSRIGYEYSLPPRVSVTVAGFEANLAFRNCTSGLNGVTLTAQVVNGPGSQTPPGTPPSGPPQVRLLLSKESASGDAYSGSSYAYSVRLMPRARSAAETLKFAMLSLAGGATEQEAAAGLGSAFPAGGSGLIRRVTLEDGDAVVDFAGDLTNAVPQAGTSNGGTGLWAQLLGTVFSVAGVERVTFQMDGDCAAFYQFLQAECTTVQRGDWESSPLNPEKPSR